MFCFIERAKGKTNQPDPRSPDPGTCATSPIRYLRKVATLSFGQRRRGNVWLVIGNLHFARLLVGKWVNGHPLLVLSSLKLSQMGPISGSFVRLGGVLLVKWLTRWKP